MKPKVSIIIPTYNAKNYIERCINSIIEQTYKNLEIIIINDGSSDNSENIILNMKKKYENIIKYYSQENQGIANTRNKGIRFSYW